jgi:hypothetical protein
MTDTDGHLNLPKRIHGQRIGLIAPKWHRDLLEKHHVFERLCDFIEKQHGMDGSQVPWSPEYERAVSTFMFENKVNIQHETMAEVERYRNSVQDIGKYKRLIINVHQIPNLNPKKNKISESAELRIRSVLKKLRKTRLRKFN